MLPCCVYTAHPLYIDLTAYNAPSTCIFPPLHIALTTCILPSLPVYCPHCLYIALTACKFPSLPVYCPHFLYIAPTACVLPSLPAYYCLYITPTFFPCPCHATTYIMPYFTCIWPPLPVYCPYCLYITPLSV